MDEENDIIEEEIIDEEISSQNTELIQKSSNKFNILVIIWLSILTISIIILWVYTISNNSSCNDNITHSYGNMYEIMDDKPIIYLYPTEESIIKVSLTTDKMTTIWPNADSIDNNIYTWNVLAKPNGTIYQNNNEYSYIFWEAKSNRSNNFNQGFCIKGEDTGEFLRNILSQIGLTPKEYNEFIVYWLPKMQNNQYNLITFEGIDLNDDYNKEYPLSIIDENGNKPDSILRLNMVWKSLNNYIEIEPQEFTTFERNGFTVVEWGGKELD